MNIRCALTIAAAVFAWAMPCRCEDGAPPSLEWLRECLVRRGVPFRLTRIEGGSGALEEAGEGESRERRLVFWTRTGKVTQTVVIAVVGDDESDKGDKGDEDDESGAGFVRIQSAGIARLAEDHPRFTRVLAYMLDRSFVMPGVAFARDAADGEIVIRADVPCAGGPRAAAFIQAVEAVVRASRVEPGRLVVLISARGPGRAPVP